MKHVHALFLIFSIGTVVPQISLAIENITINGLFKDKVVVTIDGKQQILKKNKLTPEGVKLIKSNSKEATIEIDGISKVFSLDEKIGNTFKTTSDDKNTISIRKKVTIKGDANGMYLTKGQINGKTVEFLVDTGATYVSMSSDLAKQLKIKYEKGNKIQLETAKGMSVAYGVKLKKVKVGDIELYSVLGVVSDDMTGITLLGMSFLGKLDMKREGKYMVLEK
jgi:aspartyl protease family protein